ncbi:hypothetical protein SteCoe_283 [Stentor coeruleus]|uniref:Uncharacterized protein n=1 Tax=Stentor coeruleus TaxID=5963 RepID=A0A1R2D4C2_9CILI|nr:hypothetical protein SteCoe_283 [Stentor coeruleus]
MDKSVIKNIIQEAVNKSNLYQREKVALKSKLEDLGIHKVIFKDHDLLKGLVNFEEDIIELQSNYYNEKSINKTINYILRLIRDKIFNSKLEEFLELSRLYTSIIDFLSKSTKKDVLLENFNSLLRQKIISFTYSILTDNNFYTAEIYSERFYFLSQMLIYRLQDKCMSSLILLLLNSTIIFHDKHLEFMCSELSNKLNSGPCDIIDTVISIENIRKQLCPYFKYNNDIQNIKELEIKDFFYDDREYFSHEYRPATTGVINCKAHRGYFYYNKIGYQCLVVVCTSAYTHIFKLINEIINDITPNFARMEKLLFDKVISKPNQGYKMLLFIQGALKN